MTASLKVAARDSKLSRAQVSEIARLYNWECEPIYVKTRGDLDHSTSLRDLGKTDFFTAEVDALVLSGKADIAIHSAKDLPQNLHEGLKCFAITPSIDPRDALVGHLPIGGVVGSSSMRRDAMVKAYRPDLICKDIRGNIEERLAQIGRGYDGVVIAEAALIRLKLTYLTRVYLPGDTAPLQGCLAVLCQVKNPFLIPP